jgi:hypothetical protein
MSATPLMRWGFVFLACPAPLSEDQKQALVRLAAQAWFSDQSPLRFDWSECTGELRASSDTVSLGSFVGQRFEADVHVPTGSFQVAFLVAEAQLRAASGPVAEA